MEFIDTAGCGNEDLAILESCSTANSEEARLLLEHLAQLLALGEPTYPDQRPLSIGVIAPYRAQINHLKDAIEDSAVLNDLQLPRRLSVGTVDSFQDQERDIIAITLTSSNTQGEIGSLSDIRRMNVGMTRARRKLLLVGDSSTLGSHPFFGELLAYVKEVGATGRRMRWSYRRAAVMANAANRPLESVLNGLSN